MQTARGEAQFDLYRGIVCFDKQELNISVLVSEDISETLLGLAWLENRQLVVDRKAGLLTLGET